MLPGSSRFFEGQQKKTAEPAGVRVFVGAGGLFSRACLFAHHAWSSLRVRAPPSCDTPGTIASLRHFSFVCVCAWMCVCMCVCTYGTFCRGLPVVNRDVDAPTYPTAGTSHLDLDLHCLLRTRHLMGAKKKRNRRGAIESPNAIPQLSSARFTNYRHQPPSKTHQLPSTSDGIRPSATSVAQETAAAAELPSASLHGGPRSFTAAGHASVRAASKCVISCC